MATPDDPIAQHKSDVRARIWTQLRQVAVPDSRFHYDFGEYITDFEGSAAATARLEALPCYNNADLAAATTKDGNAKNNKTTTVAIFITPDNCLEDLRRHALLAGRPARSRRDGWAWYAATLDGMERVGRRVSLADLVAEGIEIPIMVTGTGAINTRGIRFGKGHGFFDLEWGMLYSVGAITTETVAIGVVHDCQLLEEDLMPDVFDTVCDYVITPTRVVEVQGAQKPTCGILYDRLQPGMLEDIPPLAELKEILERKTQK
ncbi:hypothetical protein G7054_g7856 [Neopestalotiopsis clavispora]|nr:hypothetical protein G7054_g7856 [Neopestalotiopsis clavispora]